MYYDFVGTTYLRTKSQVVCAQLPFYDSFEHNSTFPSYFNIGLGLSVLK